MAEELYCIILDCTNSGVYLKKDFTDLLTYGFIVVGTFESGNSCTDVVDIVTKSAKI